jgi:predicted ABC-type transport system involved in lysophospholipase L1 biosynthesis ATPase subunit
MKKPPLIEIAGLLKPYGALRPMRIDHFALAAGGRAAITGLDAPASEILVNVLTGAALPDSGEVRLFGRPTSTITDAGDWMATLDRIGMVSVRALLLNDLTVAQAVAMPFTLSLDPVPDAVMAEVRRISAEAGLTPDALGARIADIDALARARVHLARALAAGPELLLLEHPSALVADETPAVAAALAADVARVAKARALAVLVLSAHDYFARLVAARVFRLDAATGTLRNRSGLLRYLR